MKTILHLETISDLYRLLGAGAPRHPLAAVVDFSRTAEITEPLTVTSGFYTIMLKNRCHNTVRYGRKKFDFQEGTVFCIGPRQAVTFENDGPVQNETAGWGLFFHPDLLRGTPLNTAIREYTFFSYEMNEALHLSEKEKQVLNDCVAKIESEMAENIDRHSKAIMVSNIESLLNYLRRYYERQFITRADVSHDMVLRFETLLREYFRSEELPAQGLPSVNRCADKLCISPNYMSDLLKKETGMSAQEHIHKYFVEEAKTKLSLPGVTVNEVAGELGFAYPQYFSRLFKSKTGLTPQEFMKMN